jgi:alpha-L-arabinofuranosidase
MAIRLQEHIRVANATALLHGGCLRKAGPFIYHDPQVEVIRRYTELSGGTRLPVSYTGPAYDVTNGIRTVPAVANVSWLDAVAVRRADGEVTVAVVNRHFSEAMGFTLENGGGKAIQPRSFEIMTGHMREMNTPIAPNRVDFEPQPCPAPAAQISLRLPPRAIGWLQYTLSERLGPGD